MNKKKSYLQTEPTPPNLPLKRPKGSFEGIMLTIGRAANPIPLRFLGHQATAFRGYYTLVLHSSNIKEVRPWGFI